VRPNRKAQVAQYRRELGQLITPPGNATAKSGGPAPTVGGKNQKGQDHARGTQTRIYPPAAAECLFETAGKKGAIVKNDHQWRGDHRLLGGHAQQAGGDGKAEPRTCWGVIVRFGPADESNIT